MKKLLILLLPVSSCATLPCHATHIQSSNTKNVIKSTKRTKKHLIGAGGIVVTVFALSVGSYFGYTYYADKAKADKAKFEKLIQKYSEGAAEYKKDELLPSEFSEVGYALLQASQKVGNTDDVKAILEKNPPKSWIRKAITKASKIEGNAGVLKIILNNKNAKISERGRGRLVNDAADGKIKQLLQAKFKKDSPE